MARCGSGERRSIYGDADRLTPEIVPGLDDIRRVATSGSHALALSRCGQLWGWGSNENHQLGDVGRPGPEVPTLLPGIGDDGRCDRVTLRVSLAGAGDEPPANQVVSHPAGLQWDGADFSGIYDTGSTVVLTALPGFVSPQSGERFAFDGWGASCSGTGLQTSIVLDRRKHCVARYRSVSTGARLLTVGSGGGTVTSSSGGILGPLQIDCGATCNAVFPEGTVVTLSLDAEAPGFRFAGGPVTAAGLPVVPR